MTTRLPYGAVFCLILTHACPAAAEIPGRLFLTPEQRAMLDNARRQNIQQADEHATTQGEVSFNGIVQGSDGQTTLWVNNRAVTGREAAAKFGRTTGGAPLLQLPYPGHAVGLKVGQHLDPGTGKPVEGYQARPKAAEAATKTSGTQTEPSATDGSQH